MKKIILSLVAVFSLLSCSVINLMPIMPKERHGAKLVVQKLDGQEIGGELITVSRNSLVLLSIAGTSETVEMNDIKFITIRGKKSEAFIYGGTGLLGGGAGGLVFGLLADMNHELETGEKSSRYRFKGALIGGALGLFAGVVIGLDKGKEEKIKLEGTSDAAMRGILAKLRSKARIANFE
jgi:hypothetical protein